MKAKINLSALRHGPTTQNKDERRVAMYADAIASGKEIPYDVANDESKLSEYEDFDWEAIADCPDDDDFDVEFLPNTF
jgi:hypothetical protein